VPWSNASLPGVGPSRVRSGGHRFILPSNMRDDPAFTLNRTIGSRSGHGSSNRTTEWDTSKTSSLAGNS
jgi:hypothetical protein